MFFLVQPENSDCRSEREPCGDHAQCVYQVGETKKGESTETNIKDNNFTDKHKKSQNFAKFAKWDLSLNITGFIFLEANHYSK